jgi:DNA-binding response OmpR family regulator
VTTKPGTRVRRVVLVDDETDFLALARQWLSPSYELATFTSGESLTSRLSALEADALILDVNLPGANGFELCRRVRSHKRFARLPILFLTASHSDVDFFRNIEVGGTAFMTKPVTRKELLAKLEELLAGRA